MTNLPIEAILNTQSTAEPVDFQIIGHSREGQPIQAILVGSGTRRVSLIGGCHADEPVGPAMLRQLARYLADREPQEPLLRDFRWSLIPHVNPDGAGRNAAWSDIKLETLDHKGAPDRAYDPVDYVRNVVRELPGEDIEFGFPRDANDEDARPENLAVARHLRHAGPFHLHGSFHGMGFAPGPWFLIEPSWIDRTGAMRSSLRRQVRAMGYPLFDVDRRGEKGFRRIDESFSTRPDSRAMQEHFLAIGDPTTAAKFKPSSMEFVRGLGGDTLTFVSEMPLFLFSESSSGSMGPRFEAGTKGRRKLLEELQRLASGPSLEQAQSEMSALGIRAMPIRDQMRLQLAFLQEGLNSVSAAAPGERPE